ncbi:MAG: PAS domain-containing protein [Herpetosiphonaceae bacterium]|nr:PAS domain-containing protein [Herpetosiphonaceae bacterium]
MEQAKLDHDLVMLHRRGAWDASTALIYTIDPDFRIVAVNAAWEQFTRGNQSEPLLQQRIQGTNLLEVMREPWRSETEALCRAIFERQLPRHEAMHDYSTEDSRCVLHTVITPLVNEQDEIIGAAFTSHDFTAHRILQDELSRQGAIVAARNAQLIATLRAMGDSVILCDQQGQIVLANEAAERLFQYVPNVLGPVISLLPKQLGIPAPYDQLGLDRAIADSVVQGECQMHREDGERILQIEARPVRAEDGTALGAVAVVHDATEERMAVRLKEEFLSVAAHELKTPVTTLKGYAQLALKRIANLPDMEPVRRSLQTIDDQADRITRLVSQLLDVSSIHAGRLELDIARFDLVEVLREVLQAEQHKTSRPPLHMYGAATAWVDADLDRIEQVMRSIVRSIRKFAGEGSAIEILVQRGRMVEVILAEQLVTDPPEAALTQRPVPATTGQAEMSLGLQIMQAIVERHGGELKIEGSNGQRLWINLSLPATHGTGSLLASEEEQKP